MYGGMGYGVVFGSLLGVLLLLGFAYIVGALASKESGTNKTVGQVIAAVIAIMAVIILLYGTLYGGVMGKGAWCKKSRYSKKKMMMMKKDMMQKHMDKLEK